MPVEYKTKGALAAEELRALVFSGSLARGEHVTLTALSERLGMSVTPIREAIRILETEGILENEPHRGIRVLDLGAAEASEVFLLRAPMESLATKLAVPRLTDADVELLEALQRAMLDANESGDDVALTQANAAWHEAIYSRAESKYIVQLVRRLWMPFHLNGPWMSNRREESLREHEAIIDAIRERDVEAAAALMHEHITRAHQSVFGHLQPPRELDAVESSA